MMILQDTFEQSYRERLLDLIYGQWANLGAPVDAHSYSDDSPVIDPEALLWCSLEFLPTEPRLSEIAAQWVIKNPHYVVRQRIIRLARDGDPRALLWQSLDPRKPKPGDTTEPKLSEPLHGLRSTEEVLRFARRIEENELQKDCDSKRLGRIRRGSATLLLRARDLLGHDIRHFLLIYLLANPQGGKLKDLQTWSKYAYRSLSDAADRWKSAEIITLEGGYCRLIAAEPFEALLQVQKRKIVLVNWWTVFETSIRLLRDLAKARSKGFGADDSIIKSLKNEAAAKLKISSLGSGAHESLPLRRLINGFAEEKVSGRSETGSASQP